MSFSPDALDRHITGNYGEDQYPEEPKEDEFDSRLERIAALIQDAHKEIEDFAVFCNCADEGKWPALDELARRADQLDFALYSFKHELQYGPDDGQDQPNYYDGNWHVI